MFRVSHKVMRDVRIPALAIEIVTAVAAAGLLLAIIVPMLERGTLRGWMVWTIITTCVASAVFRPGGSGRRLWHRFATWDATPGPPPPRGRAH